MHRIDGPGATAENKFTEGNPSTGVPATQVTDAIMNALQEEIAAVIEDSGAVLDKLDNTQLLTALKGAFLRNPDGYMKLSNGLIVQWGGWSSPIFTAGMGTVNYPIAWPTGMLRIVLTDTATSLATVHSISFASSTLTNFVVWAADNAGVATATAGSFIAIGY